MLAFQTRDFLTGASSFEWGLVGDSVVVVVVVVVFEVVVIETAEV